MNIKIFENVSQPKVEAIGDNSPMFLMSANTYSRIKSIIDLSPKEVSWFSHVEKVEDAPIYIISDAYLVEQTVHPTETEMTTEGLSKFMESMIEEKGIKFYNEIRCWGHSHVEMSPTPSGQDLRQIMEFNNGDIYIMLIINKKGSIYSALYDFKNGIRHINVPVIMHIDDNVDSEQLQKELKEKVKESRGFVSPYQCSYSPRQNVTAGEYSAAYKMQEQIKQKQSAIINGQECLIDDCQFEDFDDISFEDVPSLELTEKVFTLSNEILDDFKRNFAFSEVSRNINFDGLLDLYCNLTRADKSAEKNIIINEFYEARLNESMQAKVYEFVATWEEEFQEIIAYTNTWDLDFEIESFDSALEYYEYIIGVILGDEDDELEDEDNPGIISDDPKIVNEIILREEEK